ncbi:hypothetical protein WMY93_005913 [Mugilogobius chulae]|uniref:Peroxisomal ATPase PEX6 n=1 Tax=Mugilogobius chulae TaxID=88201 RepID=A0AAW0PPK2_9GOBI
MAAQAELCLLDPFPTGFNPLDALLPRAQLQALLGEEDREQDAELQAALLFTPHRPERATARGVFLRVSGSELELEPRRAAGRTDGVLQLWVSPLFLRLHSDLGPGSVRTLEPVSLDRAVLGPGSVRTLEPVSLDRVVLGPGSVRTLEPVSLDRVVLGPGSVRTLEPVSLDRVVLGVRGGSGVCAQDQELLCGLLQRCGPLTLVERGKPLLLLTDSGQTVHFLVLDCSPVSRGRVAPHTCVLLTDCSDWPDPLQTPPLSPSRPIRLCVSDFAVMSEGLSGRSLLERRRLLEAGLTGSYSGCVCRQGRGQGASRLRGEAGSGLSGGGLISSTLWFNLSEGEPLPVHRTSLRIKRWLPAHSPGPRVLLPHAQVVVSWRSGSVPVQNHPDLLQSSEGVFRSPVLFFRVQRISSSTEESSGCFLCDRDHTSLYLGVATNSPAPFVCVGGASLWSRVDPPGLSQTVDRLCETISPHLTNSSLGVCSVLLCGSGGSGKMTVIRAAAHKLNLHLTKVDCVTLCSDSPAASEVKISSVFDRSEDVRPCVLVLRNLHLLLRAGGADQGRLQCILGQRLLSLSSSVVVVASVPRPSDLSAAAVPLFLHQVTLQSPDQDQRRDMFQGLTQDLELGPDVDLERLAKATAGFVLGDLSALVSEAAREARHRLLLVGVSEEQLVLSGVCLQDQDFSSALRTLQDSLGRTVGAPKIPCVRWEDVGGLQDVKRQILDTVSLPLTRPELTTLGLNRTGLLLFGPPGTGKTLLAKAVATECSMNFLSVKGPELINMYVGQSEENVRRVFSRARAAAPCVVFFDELDSLAPSRGRSGDSGGVMDRVVSQLLSELDTLQSSGVFVIGATNRPDLIDQSLLRPGRFDKLVYVGVNEDRDSQLQVLQAVLRKFELEPCVDLAAILERCPGHMTGADLYSLCCDAMTTAIKRKIGLIQQGLDSEDSAVRLSLEDFFVAVKDFKPSVSERELQRYKNIQNLLSHK